MKKQKWHKPGIKGGGSSCPCCPTTTEVLNMKTKLYGSGWRIVKDGKEFFREKVNTEFDDCKNVEYIESLIKKGCTSEYRAELDLPLRSAVYQRHSKDNWVLIEKGEGYA